MPKLTKISTHKLEGQIFTQIEYIPSRSQMQHNLPKYPGGKLRSDQFLYHEMPKMAKKLPYILHGWAFYKIAKFALTKKGYQ